MILGLLGPAGSGKTTVASYLVERYDAKEYTFAHPLKKLVRSAFGLPKEAVYGTQDEKEERREEAHMYSGRELMQRVGQGVREAWGENFWADSVLRQIAKEMPPLVVISDVRHVNEAEALLSYGGLAYVIRIENAERNSNADPEHPSESEWRKARYNHLLINEGKSLEDLHGKIDELCKTLVIFPKRRPLAQ